MYQAILIFHVLIAFAIVGLVLIQHGKGAEVGASFGGSSQSVFGSQGSGSFLFKLTMGFAILFFVTSITLTRIRSGGQQKEVVSPLEEVIPLVNTQDEGNKTQDK